MYVIKRFFEDLFGRAGDFINKYKIAIVIIFAIFFVFMASQIRHIKINTSTESFLHNKDLIEYNSFRDTFGRDEVVILMIGGDIFTDGFLKKLDILHKEIANNVPYLKNVNSLINARLLESENDELIADELLKTFPENAEQMENLKNIIKNSELYTNNLISKNMKYTAMIIESQTYAEDLEVNQADEFSDFDDIINEFDISENNDDILDSEESQDTEERAFLTDAQNNEMVNAIQDIIEKNESKDFAISITGSPVITNTLKRSMLNDMRIFIFLLVITISLIMLFLFRKISGVLLPMIVVIYTLITTIGLMCFFRVALTLLTNILPALMMAISVGASIHLLSIFYQQRNKGKLPLDAIRHALSHSGLAIMMTSLTTAAGLFSFAIADIAPLSHLGIFASIGVIISLVATIFLLPSLLLLMPLNEKKASLIKETKHRWLDRFLLFFADISTKYSKTIIAVSFFMIVIAIIFSMLIRFSFDFLAWMPDSFEVKKGTVLVDKEMQGSTVLEVVIDTNEDKGIYDPELLRIVDKISEEIKTYNKRGISVGKILHFPDMIKEINMALNGDDNTFYKIPDSSNAVAQEILLFENSGSDDLNRIVDFHHTKMRMSVKTKWQDAQRYKVFIDYVDSVLKRDIPDGVDYKITGMIPLMSRVFTATMNSTAKSYIFAFLMITVMMIFMTNSIKFGLISMIPNILPVLFVTGLMGIFKINMDMFVMLTGCIIIGLAVDDTVHFIHQFTENHKKGMSNEDAIRETLATSGRAMFITSLVLSSGFMVFLFATMNNLFYFGLLTAVAIIIALLADFLLAPALMNVIVKEKTRLD